MDGLLGFIEGDNGFDDEEIDSAGNQAADLFGEGGAGLVEAGFSQRLKVNTEGADGSGDECCSGLFVLKLPDGLASELGSGLVDGEDLILKAVAEESEGICAEGVSSRSARLRPGGNLRGRSGRGRAARDSARRSND